VDYSKHSDVLKALETAQENDQDNREASREAHLFVDSRDGQWEPGLLETYKDRPRYTFDKTTPVIDQISNELEGSDFDIKISPSGGEATKDSAEMLDGLVRNIENISDFDITKDVVIREVVTGGVSAWVVKHKYVDDESFDMDLVIEPIANAVDSVWFGPFNKPDASDMREAWILEAIPKDVYDERWPEGSGMSVDQGRLTEAYYHKHEHVIVGQVYYLKEEKRELLQMSNGMVLWAEEAKDVLAEMEQGGVTISGRRNVPKKVVMTRLFDGGGWLNEPQETVFVGELPVVPVLANLKFFENKVIYRGAVEKLIDPQRVYNYAKSREIEEGALAPRSKYWMTQKQAAGFESTLGTLNTNSDPVQFYNADPEAPGIPQQVGGAAINPGLATLSADMKEDIRDAAGFHEYFKAFERAIQRTGRILVNAIPKVYDTQRQLRILKDDGSYDMVVANQQVFDAQSQRMVTVNDLTAGKYDVICNVGQSFDNRQQETVEMLTTMAAVDPTILELGGDILFNNIAAPGMDKLAERKRMQLFQAGMIPDTQLTEEEQMMLQQAAQQPPPEDPAMVLAQAEIEKANADKEANQVKMLVEQEKVKLEQFKLQLQQGEQEIRLLDLQLKARKEEVENESQAIENEVVRRRFALDAADTVAGTEKKVAETDKIVKETALMGLNNGQP
jgi:hypothetical protein